MDLLKSSSGNKHVLVFQDYFTKWPMVYTIPDQKTHRESSFHHCGGSVKLLEAWLCSRRHLESSFHYRGGSVKLVQACLYARKARERCLHHCGGPVKHVEACLSAGDIEKAVFTIAEVL